MADHGTATVARRGTRLAISVAGALLACAAPLSLSAGAAVQDVSGVFGADHSSAPGAATSESAFGAIVGQRGAWEGHALAGRFDDSSLGPGTALGLGLGSRVVPHVVLRASASSSWADGGGRALRLRLGPRLELDDSTTLVIDGTRISDGDGGVAHGAIVEGERALGPGVSLLTSASLARTNARETLASATVGGAWSPWRMVVLSIEGGYAKGASLTGATESPAGPGTGPLGSVLGGGSRTNASEAADAAGATLALGIRFVLP